MTLRVGMIQINYHIERNGTPFLKPIMYKALGAHA